MDRVGITDAGAEDLVARAAHDLQAPLRAVAGMLDLLARRYQGRLDPDADEIIALVRESCAHMSGLLDRLLDLGQAGSGPLALEPVDLTVVVDRVLIALEPAITGRGIAVAIADLPVVQADPVLVHQVLLNLMANAVAFGGSGPAAVVAVGSERVDDVWRVTVSDTGPGIAPEDRERVFKPFERLLPSADESGTGLGLSIAERAVNRHGGTIGVEPRPGGGSIFAFTLPADVIQL